MLTELVNINMPVKLHKSQATRVTLLERGCTVLRCMLLILFAKTAEILIWFLQKLLYEIVFVKNINAKLFDKTFSTNFM